MTVILCEYRGRDVLDCKRLERRNQDRDRNLFRTNGANTVTTRALRSSLRVHTPCGMRGVPLGHMRRRRARRIPQEGPLMGRLWDRWALPRAREINPAAGAQPGGHRGDVAPSGPP